MVYNCFNDYELPIYRENVGRVFNRPQLPLPPREDLPVAIRTYEEAPEEPVFDPKIHLNLERPSYARLFPDFKKSDDFGSIRKDGKGSNLAYTPPFSV